MSQIDKIYGVEQSPYFFKNLYKAREKLHKIIIKQIDEENKIIDIGSTPVLHKHENFFLNHYKYKQNLTCFSNQNLDALKDLYPDLKTIVGDGRDTGLLDNSYDISISNATLEHVGNFTNQSKFVQEMYRIAKSKAIIVTPNRFRDTMPGCNIVG